MSAASAGDLQAARADPVFAHIRDEVAMFRRWEPEKEYEHLGTFDQGLRRNSFIRNVLIGDERTAEVSYR